MALPHFVLDHAGRSMRCWRRSRLARPYIWRLSNLSRVIWPAHWALLHEVERAAFTAASFRRAAAKVAMTRRPDALASLAQLRKARTGAGHDAVAVMELPRTRSANRRTSVTKTAAPVSCAMRPMAAVSVAESEAGSLVIIQARDFADGRASAGHLAGGKLAGRGGPHAGRGRNGDGARRRGWSQCDTWRRVPRKPHARSSRQSARAFSQPCASR